MKFLLVTVSVLAVLAIVQAKPPGKDGENHEGPIQGPHFRPHLGPHSGQHSGSRPEQQQQPNEESPAIPQAEPVLLGGKQDFWAGNHFGENNDFIEANPEQNPEPQT